MDELTQEHRQEVFSNKFGTTKAVVCSCGFATTYTTIGNNADADGLKFFNERHAAGMADTRAALAEPQGEPEGELKRALEARDAQWWAELGRFRKALDQHGLHGHYNLLQEFFGEDFLPALPAKQDAAVEADALRVKVNAVLRRYLQGQSRDLATDAIVAAVRKADAE